MVCVFDQMANIAPMQLLASQANTYVDQQAALDIDSKPFSKRLSGIICTIGQWNEALGSRNSWFEGTLPLNY